MTFGFTGTAVPTGAAVVVAVDNPNGTISPEDVATQAAVGFSGVVAQLTTAISLTSVLAKQGPDETGPSALIGVSITGASGGNSLPPNVSVLVTKNTNQGGRSGRGRMYLPGFREDQVNVAGIIDNTYVGNMQDALDDFVTYMTGADLQLVLEHGPDSPFNLPGVVSSLTCQAKVATQRRRLRR